MKTVRITVKNYRGFIDLSPLHVEIGPGFTALLGPNNSGKSSLKLMFYELRELFSILCQPVQGQNPNAYDAFFGKGVTTNYGGITDVEELFNNNAAGRSISLEIEIVSKEENDKNEIYKVLGMASPQTPHTWTFSTWTTKHPNRQLFQTGYNRQSTTVAGVANIGTVDCSEMMEVMRVFRDARYYGPFRNAINQGAADHYDMKIGTAFIDLWNEWKTSGIKSKTLAINQVTEDIRRLFEFERLEINASQSLKTLIVTINGNSYRLNELGSGLAQFIMVLGNAATARPSLLLLDEPETNLHPSLQADFLLSAANYAKFGCIFSTHSVGLARSVADKIFSFQKREGTTVVRPFESTPNYLEFIGELSFSTFKELGGDRLLLVEGVNDVKTIQQLLRAYKKEHTTIILPLGGDQLATGGREAELNELTRLSGNVCAFVDSERSEEAAPPSARRKIFGEVCERLNIKACISKYRAIENYFPDHAVKAAFGGKYKSLAPFERLDESDSPWAKSDSWKIARHMTREDICDTDLGAFLEDL